jgi:LysR family glycine cleavage system transcriptional activator
MQEGQASDRFTIAAPREFYGTWLAPRLAAFRSERPGTRYQLVADEEADFTEANLDIAIRLADGPGDLEGIELAAPTRVTVAAEGAPDEWIAWPGAQLPEGVSPAIHVGNAGQAYTSALAGLGRAILPHLLVEDALEKGLLKAIDGPEQGRRAYWLVAPLPQWRQKKVKALVAFLSGEK